MAMATEKPANPCADNHLLQNRAPFAISRSFCNIAKLRYGLPLKPVEAKAWLSI
jgi:hypothetical protein